MAIRINTNVAAIAAQRHIGNNDRQIEHSIKALASGNRIVTSGDDAAGLAIAEGLRGQIAGLKAAQKNAENAVSLVQTAEGGLNEQNNILIRLRELAVQAASDTVGDVERGFLDEEFNQLQQEFERIANTTSIGKKQLLAGTGEEFEFHIGAQAGEENIVKYTLDADSRGSTLGIDSLGIAEKSDARDSLENIDNALEKIGGMRANFGAMQSRFSSAINHLGNNIENIEAAHSKIADVDIAEETANLAKA